MSSDLKISEVLPLIEWSLEGDQDVVENDFKDSIIRRGVNAISSLFGSNLPPALDYHINSLSAVKSAVTSNASLVAFLHQSNLEVRSSKNNYEAAVGCCNVLEDSHPSRRQLWWTASSQLLVLARSVAILDLFDSSANYCYSIPLVNALEASLFDSLACVASMDSHTYSGSEKWLDQIFVLQFDGSLNSYHVGRLVGYHPVFSMSLVPSPYIRHTTALKYIPTHRIVLVGGDTVMAVKEEPQDQKIINEGRKMGVAMFRRVDVMGDSAEQGSEILVRNWNKNERFEETNDQYNRFKLWCSTCFGIEKHTVLAMSCSSCWSLLAVSLSNGSVAVFNIPSLTLVRRWEIEEISMCIPSLSLTPKDGSSLFSEHSFALEWWSNKELVIQVGSGRVYVVRVESLARSECKMSELSAGPAGELLTSGGNGCFFLFSKVPLENAVAGIPSRNAAKYQLTMVKAITPKELMSKRIDLGQFSEAILLAQRYNLDSDEIYKRQWQIAPCITVEFIEACLSKVNDVAFVLNQCMDVVPKDRKACECLLRFGLQKATQLAAQKDSTKDYVKYYTDALGHYLSVLEIFPKIHESINAHQFNHITYQKFRERHILDLVLDFTKDGNVAAAIIILNKFKPFLFPYWLIILSCLPEVIDPLVYEEYLPSVKNDGSAAVEIGLEVNWQSRVIWPLTLAKSEYLEDAANEEFVKKYLLVQLPLRILIVNWYADRVLAIDRWTAVPRYVLRFLKLVVGHKGILELKSQMEDYEALCLLNYRAKHEMTIDIFRALPPIDVAQLMLSHIPTRELGQKISEWVIPFFEKNVFGREAQTSVKDLVEQLLLASAKDSLRLPLAFFQKTSAVSSQKGLPTTMFNESEKIAVCRKCLLAFERTDGLDSALQLSACMPDHNYVQNPKDREIVQKIDTLLEALRVFTKYGINLTFAEIDAQSRSPSGSSSLITRLVRKGSSFNPKQWSELLLDVFSLTPVPLETDQVEVMKLFVGGMLSSEDLGTISHALDYIDHGQPIGAKLGNKHEYGLLGKIGGATAGRRSRSPSPAALLPKARLAKTSANEVILKAGREYINAAKDSNDPILVVANAVLCLLPERSDEIQCELDLLEALQLMHDFQIDELPLQVRISQNRFNFIADVLERNPAAYKEVGKLLKLARLLHVDGCDATAEKSRKGRVMSACVEQAIAAKHWSAAAKLCRELTALHYVGGIDTCLQLAAREDFTDLETKYDLLTFALSECPPEGIGVIMNRANNTKLDLIQSSLRSKSRSFSSEMFKIPDLVTRKTSPPVQQTPSELCRVVLDDLVNSKVWDSQKVPLYSLRDVQCDVGKGADVMDSEQFLGGVNALRLNALRSGTVAASLEDSILAALARVTLSADLASGLLMLLSMQKKLGSGECFDKLPKHPLTYELALYYHALVLFGTGAVSIPATPGKRVADTSGSAGSVTAGVSDVWQMQPRALIMEVWRQKDTIGDKVFQNDKKLTVVDSTVDKQSAGTSLPKFCNTEDIRSLVVAMEKYARLLNRFWKAANLQKVSSEINVVRFTNDEKYRKESILGVAMKATDDALRTALALGEDNDVDKVEIAFAHVEFLMTDSGLSAGEVQTAVKRNELISILGLGPVVTRDMMRSKIWPLLSGTDHPRLLLYYWMLDKVYDVAGRTKPEFEVDAKKTQFNVKILQALTKIVPKFDYKLLTTDSVRCKKEIEDCVDASNAQQLASLVAKVPDRIISGHEVILIWTWKQFRDVLHKHHFAEALKRCQPGLEKLNAECLAQFARDAVFERDLITYGQREQLLSRLISISETRKLSCVEVFKRWLSFEQWFAGCNEMIFSDLNLASGELLTRLHQTKGEPEQVLFVFKMSILDETPDNIIRLFELFQNQCSIRLEQVVDSILVELCRQEQSRDPSLPGPQLWSQELVLRKLDRLSNSASLPKATKLAIKDVFKCFSEKPDISSNFRSSLKGMLLSVKASY